MRMMLHCSSKALCVHCLTQFYSWLSNPIPFKNCTICEGLRLDRFEFSCSHTEKKK